MTSLGQPIAIRVTGSIRSSSSARSSAAPCRNPSTGRWKRNIPTNGSTGWTSGALPARAVLNVDATPTGTPTPPTSFPTTVHAEVNLYWTPLWSLNYDTRDTWYWDRFNLPSGTAITKTYTYTTRIRPPGSRGTYAWKWFPPSGECHRTWSPLALPIQKWPLRHGTGRFARCLPALCLRRLDQDNHELPGADDRLRPLRSKRACMSISGSWTIVGSSAPTTTSSTSGPRAPPPRSSKSLTSLPAPLPFGISPTRRSPST